MNKKRIFEYKLLYIWKSIQKVHSFKGYWYPAGSCFLFHLEFCFPKICRQILSPRVSYFSNFSDLREISPKNLLEIGRGDTDRLMKVFLLNEKNHDWPVLIKVNILKIEYSIWICSVDKYRRSEIENKYPAGFVTR